MTKPIVILDRDGVVNQDSVDYIKSPEEWVAIPGSLEAIARLHQNQFRVFIATNQSGIGRGIYSEESLKQIHQKMLQQVIVAGGNIEGVMYCPHHPDDNCPCRKPKPGLLEQISIYGDIRHRPFVGDSLTDIEAALAAGCEPVLVLTGSGTQTARTIAPTIQRYPDLLAFADHLIATRPD